MLYLNFHCGLTFLDKEKCIIDHHIDYRGNDIGPKSSQTDFKECLVHCRREGAKYFTFLGNNDCWCKTSDVGAGSVPDAVSGPATCYSSHGFEDPGTEYSYHLVACCMSILKLLYVLESMP